MASTLIHNVRIFDGEEVISQNGYVLFGDGVIKSIGTDSTEKLPDATIVIDGEGNTLLPGLIDAHVHIHAGAHELAQALKFGITTVLDMFNEPDNVASLKKIAVERNDIADIKSALHAATIEGGWPSQIIMGSAPEHLEKMKEKISKWPKLKDLEDAEGYVAKYKELGADYIKLIQECGAALVFDELPTPSLELQTAIVQAAHSHNLITIAHALSLSDTLTVLKAGTDGLAHSFCDQAPTKELVEAYKKNNSFLITTLVICATMTGEEKDSSEAYVGRELSGRVLDEAKKTCFCGRMMVGKGECKVGFAYETARLLKEEGIDVICGTDTATDLAGTTFGLSLHQELSLLTSRCGFTPAEALRSATATTARRFGLKDRGRLTEGLRADVLMVKGDPTVDIGCTMDIAGIWRGGAASERV